MMIKTAILSLLLVSSAFAATPQDASTPADPNLTASEQTDRYGKIDPQQATPSDENSLADQELQQKLEEDLTLNPRYWRFLGCGRYVATCYLAARYYRFNYWAAVKQPWRCGRYRWACYARR